MPKKTFLNTRPYRGTRDFLPEEMSVRSQVFDTLYQVLELYGYLRYDGPTLEPLEIYEAKSSEEIVRDQLFRLVDRGGRELAIRPEMTPSVARIIAGNLKSLRLPIRWYTHVNCHRYERPQRGRVREHWQINADIFGTDSTLAEAEMFQLIDAMFAALGVSPSLYDVRVSDRNLLEDALERYVGMPRQQMRAVVQILDRWEKQSEGERQQRLAELGFPDQAVLRLTSLTTMTLPEIAEIVDPDILAASNIAQLSLAGLLPPSARFDPSIVRAFDYYTSTVFEVFDVNPVNSRSLFGGGRYDNLVSLFSDQKVPAIGFGMGDVTLFDFLTTHGLLPEPRVQPEVFVIPVEDSTLRKAWELAERLRAQNVRVVAPLEKQSLGKNLREASKAGASIAVIVGEREAELGEIIVRDLLASEQRQIAETDLVVTVDEMLSRSESA
jgi:histidyl-tRNA synthetase